MKLVFATQNPHKLEEVRLLIPDNIKLLSLSDIGCLEELPETADTLEDNAIMKARYVYQNYGYACFADDTGLIVDALNGAPGVYSARYAGAHKSADDNIDKLLENLGDNPNRDARFTTIIALQLSDKSEIFEGTVEGSITMARRGEEGFGYDPVFQPEGYAQTFAELPIQIKNEISHRGRAFRKLSEFLSQIAL